MSIIEAIILGLLQGLTEFIPVSSSGHLILAHEILGTNEGSLQFDVALHVGTLFALLLYFRKDIWQLFINLPNKNKDGRLARLLILATLPALLTGLLFGDFIDENVRSAEVVAVMLALVGFVMLYADKLHAKKDKEVTKNQGLLVGFAQALALIPGVSRSGATITTGLLVGLNRERAARFSFLLAIPIVAGSAVGLFLKGSDGESVSMLPLIVGVTTAFISGLWAITFMLRSIAKLGLKPFAYYRIGLALVVFVVLMVQ